MSQDKPISTAPMGKEVTTQQAAMLGCSRPFLVQLLEKGEIPFTKAGKHRGIRMENVLKYKEKVKAE